MTVLEYLNSGIYTYGLPEKLEADIVTKDGICLCYIKCNNEDWQPLYKDDHISKDYLTNNKNIEL